MSFLPSGFEVPKELVTDRYRLRPITIHDAVKDYDAVMTNREYLWSLFGDSWGWPPSDLTLEQDMIDLAWHQKEAQLRRAFNYSIMSLDEDRLLGCVYLDPAEKPGYDAEVSYWVRRDDVDPGLELHLRAAVDEWLEVEWPFKKIGFPGRDTPWAEWETQP